MIVWVTRDEPDDGPLSTALRDRGLEVLLEPVVVRRMVSAPEVLLADLGPADWLILTSPFAIQTVAQCSAARVPQVAVVGESSRVQAEAAGLRVELVGADGHGATLFAALRTRVRTGIVCYPRSAKAQVLEPWGQVDLRCPVLYDTVQRDFDTTRVRSADVAAVAAPSQVAALRAVELPLASIGRATSEAIRALGREPAVEAPYPTFAYLAEAVAEWGRGRKGHR